MINYAATVKGRETMKRIKPTEEVKATRIFTDREEPRNTFWQQYNAAVADLSNEDEDIRVIHYYGVGGIGKTSLLKKLMEEMNQQLTKPLYAHYNFESGTDTRDVLKALKAMLERKYQFDFILFNLGLYIYAQKRGEDAVAVEKKSLLPKEWRSSAILRTTFVKPAAASPEGITSTESNKNQIVDTANFQKFLK